MGSKKRNQIDDKFKWRIEDMYKDNSQWEVDFRQAESSIKEAAALKGTLSTSAESLYNALNRRDESSAVADKVYTYAHLKHDEDTGNAAYQGLAARADAMMTRLGAAFSFIEPEILAMQPEKLQEFMSSYKPLQLYAHYIDDLTRLKGHILSEEMEAVLAKVSEIGQASGNIFSILNNADLKFSNVLDENGKEQELTQGNYSTFMENRKRCVRKAAFNSLYTAYQDHKNTLAQSYYASVQKDVFFSKERNYPSCLEASLSNSNIPVSVYHNLIETVEKHLPSLHKYIDVRKRALKLDKIHMYDLYVPLVEEVNTKIEFDKARETVVNGLAPLGAAYVEALNGGFESGWIDIYENKGKKSGAYSWGSYSSHPYVLLNYDNTLGDMFTLAHEMGHSMHSYYTRENQPYIYGDYTLFVAEVASTVNEALLMEYLLAHETDGHMKKYLVNYFMEQFRGTLFRQTMFAEFELTAHEMVEAGQALTGDVLNALYRKLNAKYYGPDICLDDEIDYEWSRIPHFYRPFYVYQYATGYSAAIHLSRKILDGEKDGYLKFLKAGSSMYSIDLLNMAGVNMEQPEAVDSALKVFAGLVDKFERFL